MKTLRAVDARRAAVVVQSGRSPTLFCTLRKPNHVTFGDHSARPNTESSTGGSIHSNYIGERLLLSFFFT